MPTIDSSYSTLQNIRESVRELTNSLSTNQLADATIDKWINTFILYDFPQHLRMNTLRKSLTFYTQPNIDTYGNNVVNPNDPLFNFINQYTSITSPIYVAGINIFFSESREQYYAIFPQVMSIRQIATGDGITTTFTGVSIDTPMLQNNVLIQSIDANDLGMAIIDQPVPDPVSGNNLPDGNLVLQNNPTINCGTINYVTGVYTISFVDYTANPTAPALGKAINFQCWPYTAAKPQAVLFYNNQFIFRPVPDQSYKVTMDAYVRPSILLSSGQSPDIAQWWELIAYGASVKILQRRIDDETLQKIFPEYLNQMRLAQRKTIMEMANERTATIFTEQTSMGTLSGGGSNWGGF